MKSLFPGESKIIKIALIGCGRAAERIYLPALNKLHNVKVTAAIDPIAERRNFISGKFTSCVPFESIDDNLINEVDAGIITTPPDTHINIASEFLKRNRYILVEKPLAPSMNGINELRDIEFVSKASLMIGFNHRYWQPVARLKEKLDENTKIDSAEIIFTSNYSKWNPVSFVSDPLDDLGSHVFDLVRYIFNAEIISINADSAEANNLKLIIKMSGNILIHCRLAHCNETIRSIRITGSSGNFFITLKSIRITPEPGMIRNILDINDRIKIKLLQRTFPIIKSYEVQLEFFFNIVRSGKNAIPGTEDGISAIAAVEAARISSTNKGKEIFLNEIKSI